MSLTFQKNNTNKRHQKLLHKPDFLYGSYWVIKFLNKFLKEGKKNIVEKITFNAFRKIKLKTSFSVFYLFLTLLLKFRPFLGFILKRQGKQMKKVPFPLYPRRQVIVSLKWLVTSIRANGSPFFETRITSEFLDFKAGKKTSLVKRYNEHWIEINENRLNVRFRWK